MLGNLEDVESIGQEVFLRAFRFRLTYRYPQKFSTWLFTITRNLAINQSRRRKRSPIRNITELNLDGMDISGDPYQVAARATDDVEKQEEIARVLIALDTLPTDQKEVIVLGIFQDSRTPRWKTSPAPKPSRCGPECSMASSAWPDDRRR